jgi:hypothetical protein
VEVAAAALRFWSEHDALLPLEVRPP